MYNLFTYGTLMLPELMEQLIGRIPDHQVGTLNGFQRFQVRNEHYPAIVSGPGVVSGVIYRDLTRTELTALDSYESSLYQRCRVDVTTSPALESCETYVIADSYRDVLSDTAWNFEAYCANYRHAQDTP